MYNERFLNPEYLALSAEELAAKHKEYTDKVEALVPMLIEHERLETEAYIIKEVIAFKNIEAGTATPAEVHDIISSGASSLELHNAVEGWIAQVSTSDKLSVISLEDGNNGSSEYTLVPFSVDLSAGVDDELVASVERVATFLSPTIRSSGLPFRVNDERLYVVVGKTVNGYTPAIAYGDRYYNTDGNYPQTVREALEICAEQYPSVRAKRLKAWAESDRLVARNIAESKRRKEEAANPKKRGLLSFFKN